MVVGVSADRGPRVVEQERLTKKAGAEVAVGLQI